MVCSKIVCSKGTIAKTFNLVVFMISAIYHVAIICADYSRSKHFYTEVLGFKVLKETYRAERNSYKLDLRVGEKDQIELFSFDNPPERPSYPEARGLRHLAFEIDLYERLSMLCP